MTDAERLAEATLAWEALRGGKHGDKAADCPVCAAHLEYLEAIEAYRKSRRALPDPTPPAPADPPTE